MCMCRLVEILDNRCRLAKLQCLTAHTWNLQSLHVPSETAPAWARSAARSSSSRCLALVVLAPKLAAGVQQINRCLQPERWPGRNTVQNTCRTIWESRIPNAFPHRDETRMFDDASSSLKCTDMGSAERKSVADLLSNKDIMIADNAVRSQSARGISHAIHSHNQSSGVAQRPRTGLQAGSHSIDHTWTSLPPNGMREVELAWTPFLPECSVSRQADSLPGIDKLAIPATAQTEANVERKEDRDRMLVYHGLTVLGAHDFPNFGVGSPYKDVVWCSVSGMKLRVGLCFDAYPSL